MIVLLPVLERADLELDGSPFLLVPTYFSYLIDSAKPNTLGLPVPRSKPIVKSSLCACVRPREQAGRQANAATSMYSAGPWQPSE